MAEVRSRLALLGASLLGIIGLGKLFSRSDRVIGMVQAEKPIAVTPPALTTLAKSWAPIGGGARERGRRRRQIEQGILKCSPV
ncbi:hypothetical protein [Chromobacterium haemolyticum]|uniref:hypothetical protein n=1 Tax=Chromobacterium haemolyticum TaxID=394935 RepID=UPI001746E18F|nr:hypothetical protein [Chromobacterium haemolyticum]QOD81882.1 hypothetical protein IEZ30_18610 [Chromobacterium haemolyticum]